ncbi:Protease Do-like 5, chloroplastic [Vitis vinifera]|uniref:Protease Do-like 5, chloroplastic n=1 Tax=Vitis vinifera TaxID=29760 RepID=A0A438DHL2_VITVI|nr:Protease Do-like 5, chloroplastic [Vitis vinifera]
MRVGVWSEGELLITHPWWDVYPDANAVEVKSEFAYWTQKVDIEGNELKPVVLGTSRDIRVGQSCFAIGNPYGYENTLTGNSGGPLINSYGHVIGVNTATFTRKGTGVSSGVNFAIPIDTVVRTVPYLIVYGTPYSNRFLEKTEILAPKPNQSRSDAEKKSESF